LHAVQTASQGELAKAMKKAHEKLGLAVAFGAATALLVNGCGTGLA
jgi:hypothetical protein